MRVPFTMVNNRSSENVWLVISKYLVLSTSPIGVLVVLETSGDCKVAELLVANTIPIEDGSIEQSNESPKVDMITTVPTT